MAVVNLPLLKSTQGSSFSTSSPASASASTLLPPPCCCPPAGYFRTCMMVLDEVQYSRGTVTKGRTIARMTCDATRSASIPSFPTVMATTVDGMIAIKRVTKRRMAAWKIQIDLNSDRKVAKPKFDWQKHAIGWILQTQLGRPQWRWKMSSWTDVLDE